MCVAHYLQCGCLHKTAVAANSAKQISKENCFCTSKVCKHCAGRQRQEASEPPLQLVGPRKQQTSCSCYRATSLATRTGRSAITLISWAGSAFSTGAATLDMPSPSRLKSVLWTRGAGPTAYLGPRCGFPLAFCSINALRHVL
jgi:hypothetical protein